MEERTNQLNNRQAGAKLEQAGAKLYIHISI
jgi:hypothetical protein